MHNPLQRSLYAPSARLTIPSNYRSCSVLSRVKSIEDNFSVLRDALEAILKAISLKSTQNSADKPNIQPEVIISPVQINSTIESTVNKLIDDVSKVDLV